jgi:predicted AAA+ superfamily ATPase
MARLVAWKSSRRRKPLLLSGARQVGKTWLLREFGRLHFERVVYLSLDQSAIARNVFDADLDIARVIADLSVASGGGPIDPASTLIVLDEIQEAPRALAALKYFAEDAPEYHVACAGSLLGVAAHEGTSFPVGKVNFLNVYPLDFTEFLRALGEGGLADLLDQHSLDRLAPFHEKLVSLLRQYLFTGGMPEAVATFAADRDPGNVRDVHQELLDAYERDFSKHAPTAEVPKLRALFTDIPRQLARENRRFVYGQAEPGARAKTFELALQWLLDARMAYQIPRVTVPRIPLATYRDQRAFKLFALDVGLVGAMIGLDQRTLIEGNAVFTEYKGALAEQFMLQSLVNIGLAPAYWANKNGNAEVDFLVQHSGLIVPVEVKAETNLQAKSLRVYRDAHEPAVSLRASLRPYRDEGWLVNLPLYAVTALPALVSRLGGS